MSRKRHETLGELQQFARRPRRPVGGGKRRGRVPFVIEPPGERRGLAANLVRRAACGRPGAALIRIDGHHIGITSGISGSRTARLRAKQCSSPGTMLLKHLYRRNDDRPQPKIIDVFISKLPRNC